MIDTGPSVTDKDIHKATTRWKGSFHFESLVNEHIIHTDKLEKHGGENKGPRPKPLILTSIGGCTGMETISILEKMRIKVDGLTIEVSGELNDSQPKIYKAIHIIFKVNCKNEDRLKIDRAILLVMEKYCGVLAMVRHFAKTTSEIEFRNAS